MKLSQERSDKVRAFLVSKGVSKDRLQTHGFGASRIIDTRKTEDAAKRNRRVQFKVLKMKSEERLLEDHEALPKGAILKEVISKELEEEPAPKKKEKTLKKKKYVRWNFASVGKKYQLIIQMMIQKKINFAL
jgi:hypothetical protein